MSGAGGFSEEQRPWPAAAEDDLCEMTNVYPRTSGLPMTVWISPLCRARHDGRVTVRRVPGNRAIPEDTAVVAVRPRPALVEGELDAASLAAVARWIEPNRDVLIEFWDGEMDGVELGQRLRRV